MRQEKACAGFNKISAILEHSCGLLLQVDDQPSVATISAHRPNIRPRSARRLDTIISGEIEPPSSNKNPATRRGVMCACPTPIYIFNFSHFNAVRRIAFRAGFAAILIASPVAGFRPIRAFVRGLITRDTFIPVSGIVNSPDPLGFTCASNFRPKAENTEATCFLSSPHSSAISAMICVLVWRAAMALTFTGAVAFRVIAFLETTFFLEATFFFTATFFFATVFFATAAFFFVETVFLAFIYILF